MKKGNLLLKESLKKLKTTKLKGIFYRAVSAQRKQNLLDPQGSILYGGRYNIKNIFGALYFAQNQELCIEERIKLAGGDMSVLKPQVIGKVRLELSRVLDLTNENNLKKLKIKRESVIRIDGYTLCQQIASIAYRIGIEALIVPSTISEQSKNIVVFTENLSKKSIMRVISIKSLGIR